MWFNEHMTESRFDDALSRLDAEIAERKMQIADLQRRREGAQLFLDYMDGPTRDASIAGHSSASTSQTTAQAQSGTWQIVESVIDRSGVEQTVDTIWDAVKTAGHADLDRVQVRNALHYLSRKELIRAGSGRGRWRWIVPENTKAPASTGALEGEGPEEDPSIAGRSSDETELRGDRDPQDDSWGLHDRVGVQTPVTELTKASP